MEYKEYTKMSNRTICRNYEIRFKASSILRHEGWCIRIDLDNSAVEMCFYTESCCAFGQATVEVSTVDMPEMISVDF